MADDSAQRDVAKIVVLSGWSLTIAVCLLVIVAAVYVAVTRPGDVGVLKDFAQLCFGFLFGALVTLVKDYIKISS